MRHGDRRDELNELTREVVTSAVAVHRTLGNACLERPYRLCLAEELRSRGVDVKEEVAVAIRYRSLHVDAAFKMDLLVGDRVVVEVKAVRETVPEHAAQLATYLRLAEKEVGLLINFPERYVRDGIRRVVGP